MKQIRIFENTFGLRALAVWDDDLYSFCVLRDENFERNVEHAKSCVPVGFRAIGNLREKTQVTFRYLRDGSSVEELPLPKNITKLGFDF